MAPEIDDMNHAVDFIHEMISNERPVMVHCAAGKGRTGTLLAAYFIKYYMMDVDDAIARIRRVRPGSIESEYQIEALRMYSKQFIP